MQDALDRATNSARELARRMGVDHHDVLLVLGTGLSDVAEILGDGGDPLPLDTLPFFPPFGGTGHRALGWSVPIGGRRMLVMGGRCHLYEGLGAAAAVHPVRTGIAAGCSTVILTAAAGSIREDLATGSIVVVEDHLNLTGQSPLGGPAFVDLVDAYAPALRTLALAAPEPAAAAMLASRSGVYAQVHGPHFETPAEVRMLRSAGADVVGMSMAIETIAARHGGAEVLGLALVTNVAAGSGAQGEVGAISSVAGAAAPHVAAVVRHVVGSLP